MTRTIDLQQTAQGPLGGDLWNRATLARKVLAMVPDGVTATYVPSGTGLWQSVTVSRASGERVDVRVNG